MNPANSMLPAGWGWYVAILTILSLFWCIWILASNSKKIEKKDEPELHGHNVWDGLREYDNPLPQWWSNLFHITVFFALGYLALFPGLAVLPGVLGWTSSERYAKEVAAVNAEIDPIFNAYLKQDVATVAQDRGALQIGGRLFQTYCVQCHGSDMRGSKGFPNLVDADWLYPGTPDAIKTTIMEGRAGVMPAFADQLKSEQIKDVAQYVLTLSGRSASKEAAARGEATYKQICIACHGPTGKGNQALGAPNLTDDVWLYSGTAAAIEEAVVRGRAGVMPAQKNLLGEARVHMLAAYVYAQSREAAAQSTPQQ
jgi:cytochrome c oxidase cbb3-type subunit III